MAASLSMEDRKEVKKKDRQWTAPTKEWLKINVDASFLKETNDGAAGCLARDYTGKVMWACCRTKGNYQDIFEAEAWACLEGLKCMHDRSNYSVILESDNIRVVNAIRKKDEGFSRLWSIFEDINLYAAECKIFEVRKRGRESNGAAHSLACLARTYGQDNFWRDFWLGSVPPEIENVVATE
ncbi:hypothetical protein ACQ4PT_059482 [Festuca glaucescens]